VAIQPPQLQLSLKLHASHRKPQREVIEVIILHYSGYFEIIITSFHSLKYNCFPIKANHCFAGNQKIPRHPTSNMSQQLP